MDFLKQEKMNKNFLTFCKILLDIIIIL